jgi:hypothetical protein
VPPSWLLVVLSGHLVWFQTTPLRLAVLSPVAPLKLVLVRLAVLRFAPLKVAPPRFAHQHAVFPTAVMAAPPGGPAAHFHPQRCGLGPAAEAERTEGFAALTAPAGTKRAYRRSAKHTGPRTYRTRQDLFAAVWEEVCAWLTAAPERTATSVFDDLQHQYPGRYSAVQLRAFQRHVQQWRAQMILACDDSWLEDDRLTGPRLVGALRARPAS